MKRLIAFIILFVCANVIYGQVQVSQLSVFQQNAIKYYPDYFGTDNKFVILGYILVDRKNVVFAYNVTFFGPTWGRAIGRLILFNEEGLLLGMYSGVNVTPGSIMPGRKIIRFFAEPERGNVIDFSKGIPRSIWIDGEVYAYEEIVPLQINK